MSIVPLNSTFRRQQKTLVKSSFKKAFINAVHTGTNTVDVYFAENPQTIIRNIPLSKSIDISTVAIGQRGKVDIFDETNPNDMVLAFIY